ncbi:MAG: thioredoxin domain-containing protein [Ardenticatenaceae bacterium]|nr:thioredoxin domain-containing protein [Ardenticatenaceae bacterium]
MPVTIIEYTDFECPFCNKYFTETFPQIKENYIDTGLVRYVFKDLPLTSIHPRAGAATLPPVVNGDQRGVRRAHARYTVVKQSGGTLPKISIRFWPSLTVMLKNWEWIPKPSQPAS